ncbi:MULTISPECIES: hypothetical protein [unclassified Exiguobacterium]|uniref:hypothetical protein n=1 Tax=unclassified Exiguobacterium TaxID=2644629 RepID=UPI001BEB7FAA|nr:MULTISPECIES: hypothetical protein [unclassified Exiguobacterium]
MLISKDKNPMFFIILMFIMLLFTNQSSNGLYVGSDYGMISVFHIKINTIFMLLSICFISFMYNLKNIYFDKVALLLFISAVLGLIPLMYSKNIDNYIGNYIPVVIAFFSYWICLQATKDYYKYIYRVFMFVTIVISLQVISTEINFFNTLSLINFNDHYAKGSMIIPIGSSNLIACFLLPLILFLLVYKKNLITFSVVILGLYALLLCRSKNALIIFAAICILVPLYRVVKYIIKDQTVSSKLKISFLGFITLIGFIFFTLLINLSEFLINDLSFNYFSSLSNPFLNYLDRISSGRVTVYLDQLSKLNNSIFWGNGFGYSFGETKSHNWIIDALVQKGIIGTIIFIMALFLIFKKSSFYLKDKFVTSTLVLLSLILLQGMFEISIFTAGIDFLFWSMAGLLMSRIQFLNSIKV